MLSTTEIAGIPCRISSRSGAPVLVLLSAPPLGGTLFDPAAERASASWEVVVPDLFREPLGLLGAADTLSRLIDQVGNAWLVAHGLAVPIARRVQSPVLTGTFLLNGPLRHLDFFSRALGVLPERLLAPRNLLPWLSSSFGLRRAVINPYVMEAETVRGLLAPLERASTRAALLRLLRDLRPDTLDPSPKNSPLALLWAQDDKVWPPSEALAFLDRWHHGMHVTVPGARLMFPQEVPWKLIDVIESLVAGPLSSEITLT